MPGGRIYTRGGDGGETGLLGGERVRKDSLRPETCGAVDELNAWIGVLQERLRDQRLQRELAEIQGALLQAGARLAATPGAAAVHHLRLPGPAETARLEAAIDRMEDNLPRQAGFILPGGCDAAGVAHVARTVCRRAERRLVALAASVEEPDLQELQMFLNRLSDYLYVLARTCNRLAGVADVPWTRAGPAAT